MSTVVLPHNWDPRDYQIPAWNALTAGIKRALLLWHRRAGKDDFCLHYAATQAMQRVGTYWHMLPQYAQARKSVWDAVNPKTGKRRVDEAFPDEICLQKREGDMFIRFKNGSTWQLVGSDNFDALVGSPPIGVSGSEWALADPRAWAYLRPILLENGGWAVFITTVRGKNHVHKMYEGGLNDPSWFVQILTARDTGVISEERLQAERLEYQREYGVDDGDALWAQEWLCDWNAAIVGSYYGRMIRDLDAKGRFTSVPYDPNALVHTAWDLGLNDQTAIWFFQIIGQEIHIIDFLANRSQTLPWYAGELLKKGYAYGMHILPHDGEVTELQSGKTRVESLRPLLGNNVHALTAKGKERVLVADGINAVRQVLPRCWFDKAKTEEGVEALKAYRREWDADKKTFVDRPLHDWASDPADAFRYLALGLEMIPGAATAAVAKAYRETRGLADRSDEAAAFRRKRGLRR